MPNDDIVRRSAADDRDPARQARRGLRGRDKQQSGLRDVSGHLPEPEQGEPAETQPSRGRDAQQGAGVRGSSPVTQGTGALDSLPEGLQRQRKGPYDKNKGRNETATQLPKNQ